VIIDPFQDGRNMKVAIVFYYDDDLYYELVF